MKQELYYKIHINNTSMKQKFIIVLKLITKRKLITSLGNRNNSLIYIYIYIYIIKGKQRRQDNSRLYFYHKLVSWGLARLSDSCRGGC